MQHAKGLFEVQVGLAFSITSPLRNYNGQMLLSLLVLYLDTVNTERE